MIHRKERQWRHLDLFTWKCFFFYGRVPRVQTPKDGRKNNFIYFLFKRIPPKKKIALDHFHVTNYIQGGLDIVRKQEHRVLKREGILDLVGTKYDWRTNRKNMSAKQKKRLDP